MSAFLEYRLTVKECEGCAHRRSIIWWKPNFFCIKSYSPKTEFFFTGECEFFEKLPETTSPKKFSGFHLL
jgi:hypothetical protein